MCEDTFSSGAALGWLGAATAEFSCARVGSNYSIHYLQSFHCITGGKRNIQIVFYRMVVRKTYKGEVIAVATFKTPTNQLCIVLPKTLLPTSVAEKNMLLLSKKTLRVISVMWLLRISLIPLVFGQDFVFGGVFCQVYRNHRRDFPGRGRFAQMLEWLQDKSPHPVSERPNTRRNQAALVPNERYSAAFRLVTGLDSVQTQQDALQKLGQMETQISSAQRKLAELIVDWDIRRGAFRNLKETYAIMQALKHTYNSFAEYHGLPRRPQPSQL